MRRTNPEFPILLNVAEWTKALAATQNRYDHESPISNL